MAHPRRGNQLDHRFGHAEAGAQDGDHRDLLARDGGRHHHCHRRLDGLLGHGQVAGELIAHEERDLLQQLAEEDGRCLLVAHQRQLVLDQRMIDHVEIGKFPQGRFHASLLRAAKIASNAPGMASPAMT